jgi:hypothetical protein
MDRILLPPCSGAPLCDYDCLSAAALLPPPLPSVWEWGASKWTEACMRKEDREQSLTSGCLLFFTFFSFSVFGFRMAPGKAMGLNMDMGWASSSPGPARPLPGYDSILMGHGHGQEEFTSSRASIASHDGVGGLRQSMAWHGMALGVWVSGVGDQGYQYCCHQQGWITRKGSWEYGENWRWFGIWREVEGWMPLCLG